MRTAVSPSRVASSACPTASRVASPTAPSTARHCAASLRGGGRGGGSGDRSGRGQGGGSGGGGGGGGEGGGELSGGSGYVERPYASHKLGRPPLTIEIGLRREAVEHAECGLMMAPRET